MSTITTRSGKGSPLTNNEVDANFTNLNTDKLESADLADYATLSGATFTGEVEATGFNGDLTGAILFKGQAGEALTKGDPVYISGISGNKTVVSKADANDANKMPCFGIVDATVSANADCSVVTFGTLQGLDTSSFSEGDELYISNTGTLTTTAPTGEASQIQKIGKVTRSHASAGSIKVMGAGRTNATPNLDNGNFFLGNSSNQSASATFSTSVTGIALPLSGGAMTGAITTNSTFDGRDVATDGTKLDLINQGVATTDSPTFTNLTLSGTDSVKVPSGTTGQRNGSPANGMFRYNSTTAEFEGYQDGAWGSIGGGVGAEYISATPTLTTASSASTGSTITVTNHSVYNNPTYTVKQGNTARTFTQVAGILTITNVTVAETATLTVTVAESGAGKLFASASISVQLVLPAYRYWKLSGMVRSTYSGNYTWVLVNRFNVYSIPNGNGATDNAGTGALGTTSNISGSTFYTGYSPTDLFDAGIYGGWFLYNRSASQILTDAVTYDLGAPTAVASIYYRNRVGQDCSQVVISKSTDNTNWIVAATLSNLGAGEGRSVNV